jgi:hypothetical protein
VEVEVAAAVVMAMRCLEITVILYKLEVAVAVADELVQVPTRLVA